MIISELRNIIVNIKRSVDGLNSRGQRKESVHLEVKQ